MKRHRVKRHTGHRRGTTAVEAALVLPVFLLFVLGLIEFGHAMMVNNVMRSACRAGARLGSTEGQSTAAVETQVRDIISGAVDPNKVQVFVKNADVYDSGGAPPTSGTSIEALPDLELGDAESRQMFLVRTRVAYSDIAIIPPELPILGKFLHDIQLSSQAFMRHE